MRAWSIGLGCVFRRSLQALGKGLYVEGCWRAWPIDRGMS